MRAGAYLKSIRNALSADGSTLLDAALGGDALAARRLMIMAPRRLHGHLASLAYQMKLANPAYREILRGAWAPGSRDLLMLFWRPQTVRDMLAQAEFALPAFGSPLTVFRFVAPGTSKRQAAAGLCWTLSREVAAMGSKTGGRLLRGVMAQSDVIYWGNSRGEREIVARRPISAVVDEGRVRLAARL